ncbi:30S ribosomal protein S16 [Candidatus Woesebacteria bacterium CG22_combo_CG10-13_8_21_14_all_39_10]|uniref:Small ribosomal subunit protein bS16 n=2 Tax=Candidatus Woeseibacteriota TaxID=1752722 RepID=A0A2M7AQ08_9BACT|nr:MAG: 30S ribosomal protein S16 [Candidatus Woesebacteria bacterium CG22_combo_CG10-13_8_21_14_all_39_10]PIU71718.1 MAG: 30S ribosomal protein S16 [Candidatus Woesebacteria bacterium CG06_land_8_20_14_3_00_39_27]
MVKIRLSRSGVRNNPFYRIVAIEDKKGPKGKFLDIVGYWHPLKKTLKIDKKILEKWTKVGAKVSAAVEKLLKQK